MQALPFCFRGEPCPFFCVSAALCDFVRVRLVGVTALVLSTNAPRGTRAGGTYSLAEGVLGVFTSNEPKASRTDKAFVVGTLGGGGGCTLPLHYPSTARPCLGWRSEVTGVFFVRLFVSQLRSMGPNVLGFKFHLLKRCHPVCGH